MKDITAKEMHDLATSNNFSYMDEVFEAINKRAEDGQFDVYIYDKEIYGSDKRMLEEKGFEVEVGGRYNETHTYISW